MPLLQIGSGHVMRCLTLAEELRRKKMHVEFICREHSGNLIRYIRDNKEFKVHNLSMLDKVTESTSGYSQWLGASWNTDADAVKDILHRLASKNGKADWLIVDHYSLDHKWEGSLRGYVSRLMVIDDLANRNHDCDLLLDQNVYLQKNRYKNLVPKRCHQLIGPTYVLLRQQFVDERAKLRERDGKIHRILIFFGGSGQKEPIKKAIQAIQQLDIKDIRVDLIISSTNITHFTAGPLPNVKLHHHVENMAELMNAADISLGCLWYCNMGTLLYGIAGYSHDNSGESRILCSSSGR